MVDDDAVMSDVEALRKQFEESIAKLQDRFENKVEKLQRGDELPPGVMKMVKVFVAVKRKLQPGDKMAGRHGNKGVISKIMPMEDMPYLEDGTPVDIVLNPLGVPSRMNVGQILETHLGFACAGLGRQIGDVVDGIRMSTNTVDDLRGTLKHAYGEKIYEQEVADMNENELLVLSENLRKGVPIATPVFDGAREADIVEMLEKAGLASSGQVTLIDGRTGRNLRTQGDGRLHLHAQAASPGRRQDPCPVHRPVQPGHPAAVGWQGAVRRAAVRRNGGVGAGSLRRGLHASGNADRQVDDQAGRTKVYEAIVRGEDNFEAGVPESFNVLVKELQSLGLNVELSQHKY